MALFKTADRRRPGKSKEDRATGALDLLAGLCGHWTGTRREVDPDARPGREGRVETRDRYSVTFELSPDGTHVIAHRTVSGSQVRGRTFDVWGLEAATGELVRTIFTSGARQSSAYNISHLVCDRRRSVWGMVLETISWDEGRPCEIKYEISRKRNRLNLTLSRRLIARGADYEPISQVHLVKAR